MCMALGILCILVHENGRFTRQIKRRFYVTYAVISLASLAEMGSVLLNHAPDWTRSLHALVKCTDYIITPCAAICFALQVSQDDIWDKSFRIALAVNAIIQLISLFTGWTFYIDEANVYHHGPYYFLYIAVYIAALLLAFVKFFLYGRAFSKGNRLSLISIALLVILGVFLQEISLIGLRTCCLALMLGSLLLFIHYNEFAQQQRDENLIFHHHLLETDPLTGLFSRYAYNEALNAFPEDEPVPDDVVIFSIDVNGLKSANDTIGHLAGDELIRGAAECLKACLEPYGKCYRTGGDEFIAILRLRDGDLEQALRALNEATAAWKGKLVSQLSFAIGHAAAKDHPQLSIEKLFNCADRAMYQSKAQYYCKSGHDRRNR